MMHKGNDISFSRRGVEILFLRLGTIKSPRAKEVHRIEKEGTRIFVYEQILARKHVLIHFRIDDIHHEIDVFGFL